MAKKLFLCIFLLPLMIFVFQISLVAWSAEFPTKPIELIIQFAPGGPSDTTSRSIAPKLGELLGQPLIPVNKPGGAGSLAVSLLAKYKPDGYAIILVGNSSLTVVPNFESVPYDPLKDFTYLCKLFNQSPMLVVKADAPWKSAFEFFDYAKKNPKKIKYGSWGQYSSGHIAMEAIAKEMAVEIGHIPFKGDAPCVTALLGGHIDAAAVAAGYVPHVRAGKLRGIVMLQSYRSKNFPQIPSLRDAGIQFNAKGTTETTNGMIAPKGLEKDVIKKYEIALEQAGKSAEFLNTLQTIGCDPHFTSGEEFRKETEEGFNQVSELIKKLGLK